VGTTDEVFDSPVGWVSRHIRKYVDSGGTKGQRYGGAPILLLTTRGRRSGAQRRTALIYRRHGESYLVVGSNGGSAQHPQWYLNLLTEPSVRVQVGPEEFPARARTATGTDRAELWQMMVEVFRSYASYQRETDRELPVVVLEPADSAEAAR
jgi:deazaflavin-dependent oxidoreductase (nitroreductase family)